jgi:hypothetical protein
LSNSNNSKFLVRHPWDQYAFPGFVALIWLVILMGFVPEIVLKYRKQGFNYPLAVHIHAAVYVSWLVLLTVQTVLIDRGRVALHRRLGMFGAGLATLVVVMGLVVTYVVENRMLGTPRADPAFISTLLVDVLNFATLAAAALMLRGDAAAHKRLMLLATMSLLQAGFIRWWGAAMYAAFGRGFRARPWHVRPGNAPPPLSRLRAWSDLDPQLAGHREVALCVALVEGRVSPHIGTLAGCGKISVLSGNRYGVDNFDQICENLGLPIPAHCWGRLCARSERCRQIGVLPIWSRSGKMTFVKAPQDFDWDGLTQKLVTAEELPQTTTRRDSSGRTDKQRQQCTSPIVLRTLRISSLGDRPACLTL